MIMIICLWSFMQLHVIISSYLGFWYLGSVDFFFKNIKNDPKVIKINEKITKTPKIGKADISDLFSLWKIFLQKCLNFCMTVLFNLVVEHSPALFWLVCTLFLRKKGTKYWRVHNECWKVFFWGEALLFKKFRHFWRQKNLTRKSHLRPPGFFLQVTGHCFTDTESTQTLNNGDLKPQ